VALPRCGSDHAAGRLQAVSVALDTMFRSVPPIFGAEAKGFEQTGRLCALEQGNIAHIVRHFRVRSCPH